MTDDRAPSTLALRTHDALVIVDVQRDLLPGGSLAVHDGDAVVGPLNACIARFVARRLPVLASRDWHPINHCSFRDAGGRWPPHCVARTPGAAFAPGLSLPPDVLIVDKGTARERDDCSAFGRTDLHARLRDGRALRLFVGGLATDYGVRATVLDALAHGYRVVVLRDAVAAVDVQPSDGENALRRMREAGALISASIDLH